MNTTHFSVDYNYMPQSYPVNLSRIIKTAERIISNYRLEDRSEILDVPYSDEMNHMILLDLASCLIENYRNNPSLAWMGDFENHYENVYSLSEDGSEETEVAMKNMWNTLIANKPHNFDCQLNDHWSVLYDYYSPSSPIPFCKED